MITRLLRDAFCWPLLGQNSEFALNNSDRFVACWARASVFSHSSMNDCNFPIFGKAEDFAIVYTAIGFNQLPAKPVYLWATNEVSHLIAPSYFLVDTSYKKYVTGLQGTSRFRRVPKIHLGSGIDLEDAALDLCAFSVTGSSTPFRKHLAKRRQYCTGESNLYVVWTTFERFILLVCEASVVAAPTPAGNAPNETIAVVSASTCGTAALARGAASDVCFLGQRQFRIGPTELLCCCLQLMHVVVDVVSIDRELNSGVSRLNCGTDDNRTWMLLPHPAAVQGLAAQKHSRDPREGRRTAGIRVACPDTATSFRDWLPPCTDDSGALVCAAKCGTACLDGAAGNPCFGTFPGQRQFRMPDGTVVLLFGFDACSCLRGFHGGNVGSLDLFLQASILLLGEVAIFAATRPKPSRSSRLQRSTKASNSSRVGKRK
jgi:hypothetical protein